MAIVESVDSILPFLRSPHSDGLASILITTREAQLSGFNDQSRQFTITQDHPFIHIFELHPGQDPDTTEGLRNCNVQI